MMGNRRRVFVADDHALFRAGVKALLAEESDLEVAGEAGNVVERKENVGDGCLVSHRSSRADFAVHFRQLWLTV